MRSFEFQRFCFEIKINNFNGEERTDKSKIYFIYYASMNFPIELKVFEPLKWKT